MVGHTFSPNDKVVFVLDHDEEILTVVSSGFFRTQCVTFDGVEVSHSTDLLRYAQIPAAI